MNHTVQIFKALGDETRLKILIILLRRRICAKGMAKQLNISEAAVSQHLKVLKNAGIIVGEKIGYYVHYHLQESTLREITKFVQQMNEDYVTGSCHLGVHISHDCRASCNGKQKNCCPKNK